MYKTFKNIYKNLLINLLRSKILKSLKLKSQQTKHKQNAYKSIKLINNDQVLIMFNKSDYNLDNN